MSKKEIKVYKGVYLPKLIDGLLDIGVKMTTKELDIRLKEGAGLTGSTTKMSKEQMFELWSECFAYGLNIGVVLLLPEDSDFYEWEYMDELD